MEALPIRVNPHRDAAGVALDAVGKFTGLKGVFKYFILYGAFALADFAGYPISDESIASVLEKTLGWSNLDYPLTVFATHVNDITFQRALAEGTAIFAAGAFVSEIGRRYRCA